MVHGDEPVGLHVVEPTFNDERVGSDAGDRAGRERSCSGPGPRFSRSRDWGISILMQGSCRFRNRCCR